MMMGREEYSWWILKSRMLSTYAYVIVGQTDMIESLNCTGAPR